MEIAHIVDVTHHLIGRIVGLCCTIIDGFPAQFLVEPFPCLAVGIPLRFVINPIGQLGLEGAFIRLEGDVVGKLRLADLGLFPLNNDFVALDQALAFWNKAVDAT